MGYVMQGNRDILRDEHELAADLQNQRVISEIATEALARRNVQRIRYQPRTEDQRKAVDQVNEISNSSVSKR